jgi:hypothetical protein
VQNKEQVLQRRESSLREPEALSMSRPESLNKEGVNVFFSKVTAFMNDSGVFDKTNLIYNVEEKGYVLKNLTAEAELVIIAANCDANGYYCTPPIVIFKVKSIL